MLKIYLHNVLSFQITFLCSVSKRPLKLSLYMNHKVWTNTLNKTTENVISYIQSKWKKIVTIRRKNFYVITSLSLWKLDSAIYYSILYYSLLEKKKKKEKNLFRKNVTCFHLLILSLIAFNYRINPDIFRSELTLYFYHVSRFVKRSWNIHGIGYVVHRFILA